jgi:hypothetical protein
MASNIAVPGKNPGEVYIPALNKSFKQVELREDDHFDTVQMPAGAVAAGTELTLFRDLTDKSEQHTTLQTSRRIQSGDEAAIFRIGVELPCAIGNTLPSYNDMRKVVGNAQLELIFNRRTITTGPVIKYPAGYGIGGFSDETGATAFSIGVPSVAASPTLFVPQQLKDDDDIKGKIRFPSAAWITAAASAAYVAPVLAGSMLVRVFLHGVMKAPLGR